MNKRITYLIGPACLVAATALLFGLRKPIKTCVHIKYKSLEDSKVFENPDQAMRYIINQSTANQISSIDMGPCYQ